MLRSSLIYGVSFMLLLLGVALSSCGSRGPAGLRLADPIPAAERAVEAGDFIKGADLYLRAFNQRPGRLEHGFRAAELFTRARAYSRAAETYARLPEDERWPLLKLRYGRALKQSGQPNSARQILTDFQSTYTGRDRDIVVDLVANELAGLELPPDVDPSLQARHLGSNINTEGNEITPARTSGDELFFTRRQNGQNHLLVSNAQPGTPDRATPPAGFPVVTGGEIGTGAWSTDGETFFFTICNGTGSLTTDRCAIFRTTRRASGQWTQPKKLSSSVNARGSNNAYPSAALLPDGRQMLYFSSDRAGGFGGLDLYQSEQINTSDPTAFSRPVQLGPGLNSAGHEITPAIDLQSGTLTFSTDGRPGYGGFDIFRAQARQGGFGQALNAGLPTNSPADEFGLTRADISGRSYFSSNRAATPAKLVTTHDDIFQLNAAVQGPTLQARVYDAESGQPLDGFKAQLEQLASGAPPKNIGSRTVSGGAYYFALSPATRYRLSLQKDGYQPFSYPVRTDTEGAAIYGRPVYLVRSGALTQEQSERPGPGLPATSGTVYRIQIAAVPQFKPDNPAYNSVKQLGELQAETITGRRIKRVLVGNYPSFQRAKSDLTRARRSGFPDAFIVRYQDGERQGRQ